MKHYGLTTCFAAVVLASLLVGAPSVLHAEPGGLGWDFGIKVGYLLEGEITVSNDAGSDTIGTDSGLLLTGHADAPLGEKIYGGLYALYAQSGAYDEDATVFDIGLSLKARFPVGTSEIRVGPVLAYQVISVSYEGVDDTEGLNVGAVFDVAFPMTDTLNGIAELGFISQPSGGNEDVEATFGPIFYLAVGLGFAG